MAGKEHCTALCAHHPRGEAWQRQFHVMVRLFLHQEEGKQVRDGWDEIKTIVHLITLTTGSHGANMFHIYFSILLISIQKHMKRLIMFFPHFFCVILIFSVFSGYNNFERAADFQSFSFKQHFAG